MSTVYEPVMGIEVHAQLKTKTKLFCSAATQFGQPPNTNISPVCLGLPGALPVLNEAAVDMAISAGLALECAIKKQSVFSRKNYFYPDLPKGYQISQYDLPICEHGKLTIQCSDGPKTIGITRIHMEEDAGKLVHAGADAIDGSTYSLVDLNRAGVPLIEIVSEPDIRSIEEARLYVEQLRLILQHIGVCDGNMEEGSLRADINISLRPVGTETFGTRTEIKNVNSFRSIERAIKSEIKRQTAVLNAGEKVVQETRNYNDNTQTTTSLRGKEDAHDYRYFPEPDLPPLILQDAKIDQMRAALPPLPAQKKAHYVDTFKLSSKDADILIQDLPLNHYFEAAVNATDQVTPAELAKWIIGPFNGWLNDQSISFSATNITPTRLCDLLIQVQTGKVSTKMAKDLFSSLEKSSQSVSEIIEKAGGSQISDQSELDSIINDVMSANPDVVEKIQNGKVQSVNFLMGQVMKASKGRAKPDLVKDMILKKI